MCEPCYHSSTPTNSLNTSAATYAAYPTRGNRTTLHISERYTPFYFKLMIEYKHDRVLSSLKKH